MKGQVRVDGVGIGTRIIGGYGCQVRSGKEEGNVLWCGV